MTAQLLQGDCHQLLTTLPPDSVDLVLTDPPYGIMKCSRKIGWYAEKLRWAELNRVVRPKVANIHQRSLGRTSLNGK